ncbi:MAG: NusG domain II-containing protein [Tissierellaceae bacterium]|nr:NusG domain II-containing protein [Tissierellaceae bacterium]
MTKGDKILIVAIIIISLVSLGFVKNNIVNYNEKYISIQVNGQEYKKVIFDNSVIGKTIPIETEFGYNLIEIGDGDVRVIEASCPDKLDVLQGAISSPGEMIVCLPNRLVIEIKGTTETREIDYISY